MTGGGTGLGKEMSVGFAAHGAHVFVCGRRPEILEQAAAEIRTRSGGQADALVANVRDPDSIEKMMTDIWATGPLTGLVNNAGANFLAPTENPVAARLRGNPVDRHGWLILCRASLRQALDCRRPSRRDYQQSRYLGLDRIGLCGAGCDGQGRGSCDDDVAGGRMGG